MLGPGSWVVGVFLRFNSNGAATMTRLASSTNAANLQLARQTGMIDKNAYAMANYKRKIEEVRLAQLKLGTAGAGIAAGIGLGAMAYAARDAAKLQQILLSIKNETGASNAQVGGFYNTAFKIANQNAMTPEQAGEVLRSISRLTAGQFSVDQMMKIAPTVAGFASSVHFNRPDVGVDQATKTGIATAHLFRAYTPEKLTSLLDKVYRLSGLMSESPDQALRQMSYYVPMFKALGIDDKTSVATMALLDRAGFRNKVGTNVRAQVLEALGPLQLTQSAQAGKMDILTQMGLFKNGKFAFNTPSGGLDYFGELASIGKWAHGQRDKGVPASLVVQEMFSALGKQGGTVGALFMDPQMVGILSGIQKYLKDSNVGLAASQKNRDTGLGFQFTRAVSNFSAVMTELGYPWLKDLTGFFQGIGDTLHNFQAWLHNNRDAEKTIGAIVMGLTALAGIRFAIGTASLLITGARAMGLLAEAAPGIGLAARGLGLLDGIFLAGMGGRIVTIATKFGVLSVATNAMATVMGGSAVAGITGAFAAVQGALLGFALFLVSPAILALLATLGVFAATSKSAGNTSEGNVGLFGHSPKFWLDQANKGHAVPREVRAMLENSGYHLPGAKAPVQGHPNAKHGKPGAGGGHTTIGSVTITLPNVKTAKDAHEIAAALSDPRSMMGGSPATARTHPSIPMVLSVRTA